MPKNLKQSLFNHCSQLLLQRMEEAKAAMLAAQESANSNEKSSMGDKYETGRAMSQLERDMHAKQLGKLQEEYQKLIRVDLQTAHKMVETGALVRTETQVYWVAISLGQVILGEEKIMVVSPLSPIAQSFLGKKQKDTFTVNGKTQTIISVA